MSFAQVLRQIEPILFDHGFELKANEDHFVRYESKLSAIAIVDNYKEKSIDIQVGRKDQMLCELDLETLAHVFKYHVSYDQNLPKQFADFLMNKGFGILQNEEKTLTELLNYKQRQAKAYTEQLLKRQSINSLELFWKRKDYIGFLEAIEKIDEKVLTEIQRKRKNIAIAKTKN